MNIRYLTQALDRGHGGWLDIKNNVSNIKLPYSTKVQIIASDTYGELVKIMEGDAKNKIIRAPFLVSSPNGHYSFFSKNIANFTKSSVFINKKNKTLLLEDSSYRVEVDDRCPSGNYFLKFPIRQVNLNTNYSNEANGGSRFSGSWFSLVRKNELNSSKFLHYGTYSEGCITVLHSVDKKSQWSEIFLKLMRSRINDYYLARVTVQ